MRKRTIYQETPTETALIYTRSATRDLERIYEAHRLTPHEAAPNGGIYDCRLCGQLRDVLLSIGCATKALA